MRRARVLGHVGEPFLDDAVGGHLDRRIEGLVGAVVREDDLNLVPPREAAQHGVDGRDESQVVERHGVQELREIPHRANRPRRDVLGFLERRRRQPARLEGTLRQPQLEFHRGEHLPDFVVQLARDRLALLLLRLHERRVGLLQLV
jgi:hypothetical protein